MIVRRNAKSLNAKERKALVNAFLALKKDGRYDSYVHAHHMVMVPTIFPYEPRDANYRNGAHRGPNFLPWHRAFLMRLESDLRSVDDSVTLPYWDWTDDAALKDPTRSSIWDDDFMGGNGVEADDWRVATGPFAYSTGNWPIPEGMDGPALRRRFGGTMPTLPTKDDLALAMNEAFYDTPNYNSSPFTLGFRNRLEGWITQRGDNRVKLPGSQLHNRVHLWVGGSMEPMTSPNDPVFFLHHCFIDKVWADWQALQQQKNPDAAPHYAPEKGGPKGHNLDDILKPWGRKIRLVLDIGKLGYSYEQTKTQAKLLKTMAAITQPVSPFMAEQSPFWAD
ncbi:MAG TPA: tyrosinase family protein [Pyrinomonadaceae bacterium]|jgi:tyrosinase